MRKIVLLLVILPQLLLAQKIYRFKADLTIKDKLSNGQFRLTMGKVYYDKLYKKIVYKLTFPKNETYVIQDTTLYVINSQNNIESKSKTVIIPEFTVFHLALTGNLTEYGLKPKGDDMALYSILKTEKNEVGILSTWAPSDPKIKKVLGIIKMQNINKKLDAIQFYDVNGKIISKQFFKKYVNVKGLEIPTEITQMSFGSKGEKNLQQTTYKNIAIDENDEDEIYRYKLPLRRSVSAKHK